MSELIRALALPADLEWLTTLGLVFGGCCSNAWALQSATTQNPHAGTLITFAQFALVASYGLYTHLTVHKPVGAPSRRAWLFTVRLKKRAIPLSRWAVQVALFLLTSLMNNAAFAYAVPMPVHIIFRSGGLVINMLIGWLVGGRRYTEVQVASVVLVTLGVACTTLSAVDPRATHAGVASGSYSIGIALLTLALVMSGFMGLAQDHTYAQYGRGHWKEAMFYLHFLALPGFIALWRDIVAQMRAVHAAFYAPLLVNVGTQLVCVTGVHRLTSRVNSLTVALVLVVRKAVSLVISVLLLKAGRGSGVWLWSGAVLVLLGTVGYTLGGSARKEKGDKE